MTTPIRTLEATIAWWVARLGIRGPDGDWWPGMSEDWEDCDTFMSAGLMGLGPSGQPISYNVRDLQFNYGFEWHGGAEGIQRGDIPAFDWDHAGSYDHTGAALAPVDGSGNFSTIDANGGADRAVAYRVRRAADVISYIRPNYPSGGDAEPNKEDKMTDFLYMTSTGSTDPAKSIQVGEVWYQEAPGAPLFPLSNEVYYLNNASQWEYRAFLAQHGHGTIVAGDTGDFDASRLMITGDNLLKLIALRGKATKPIGNFAGTVDVGDVKLTAAADPALIAAVQANTAVLNKVLAATLALNPAG